MTANAVLSWVRRIFAAWILIVSAITAIRCIGVPSVLGAPGWLLVTIAGIETWAAAAFIRRPAGLALAGLLAAYSAAAVIHIQAGEPAYVLLAYGVLTIALYLGANPRPTEVREGI